MAEELNLYKIPTTDNRSPEVINGVGSLNDGSTSVSEVAGGLTEDRVREIIQSSNSFQTGQQVFMDGLLRSQNYVPSVSGWKIDADGNVEFGSGYFRGDITGATGTFSGTVTVGSLNIPDSTTANSFHVESDGDTYWGVNVA